MRSVIAIIVAVIMGIIAQNKGFRWWLWVLAGGIPGFIILLCMPSAAKEGIDEETAKKRCDTGNTVGGVISVIAIILIVVLIAMVANM